MSWSGQFARLARGQTTQLALAPETGSSFRSPSRLVQIASTRRLILSVSSQRSESSKPSAPVIAYSAGPNSHKKFRAASGLNLCRQSSKALLPPAREDVEPFLMLGKRELNLDLLT